MTGKNAAGQAVGYVRVSTDGQALDGVSLDAQREKVAAYCSLHGLTLLTTISDEGLSGKRADNRPGLKRALEAVCKNKAVLVVYSLSRLARSTRDCIEIADRLEKCGADLASISEKLDTTSSMGRFFFRLMASLGELERDQISERTTAAMSHMRKQGRRISNSIPFGFDLSDDGESLTMNREEGRIVAGMHKRRAGGESYHAIAAALNADGVKPKAGAAWYASSVRAVLMTAEKRKAG